MIVTLRNVGLARPMSQSLFQLVHFLQNIVNGLGDCFGLFLMHAMARTGNDAELRVP
jgi:hypothetical protein